MSAFTALNIEPDDQSDDEIDNTKELQIEEALKLYQAALKLHSQGPALYAQAAEAYATLFKSDIFRYPESVTEFARIDEQPELEYTEASIALGLDPTIDVDGVPSTLPHILYLSYKNHGQFVLDCVKYNLKKNGSNAGGINTDTIEPQCKLALDNFARALAADESDTELWRRAARVGALLGSRSIARYCLEAAVEVDDDPTVAEVDPANMEEGFAGEQLKQQLELLSDEVALSHPVMGPFKKRNMPSYLSKFMDPYSFLPDPTQTLNCGKQEQDRLDTVHTRTTVEPTDATWLNVGAALFTLIAASPGGAPAAGVVINLPQDDKSTAHSISNNSEPIDEDQIMQDAMRNAETETAEDQIMKDLDRAGSDAPTPTSGEAPGPVNGIPTDGDVPMENPIQESEAASGSDKQLQEIVLPTRKRSQSVAGLRDTPEDENNTQKRSKRIRNRDATEIDPATLLAEQRKPYIQADTDVFNFVGGILTKLGVEDLGTFEDVQAAFDQDPPSDEVDDVPNKALRDLRDILRGWDDSKASTYVNSNPADVLGSVGGGSVNAGIAAFLEHSNSGPLKANSDPPVAFSESDGLQNFAQRVAKAWMPLQDVVYEWLNFILKTYRENLWQDELKVIVVQIICFADADIFTRLKLEFEHPNVPEGDDKTTWLEEMVQILFELYLDVYSRITNPNSIVNYDTRVMTKERLDRWADFSADVIRSRERKTTEDISLRYLWASVFYATMAEGVSREHKVLCWSDLKALLHESNSSTIELQNNAVMPEISIAAAEREVNRLTTMDFFFNLFRTDNSDPMAIIETLEPVLDPESAMEPSTAEADNEFGSPEPQSDSHTTTLRDMWKFLKGSTSLRLFLWQRLREAYVGIDYNTKVFSCHLKSLEIIVAHLQLEEHVNNSDENRRHKLLVWLKALDDLLVKALSIALNDADQCFEIIDERHIKSTCSALAQLNRILHAASLFDDEVKLGITQLPNKAAFGERGNFTTFMNKLREMQVRTWALQYTLVKEGMSQNKELFPSIELELSDYLTVVHFAFGLRKFCKASNKIFLKMMKVEMIRMKHVDRWEDYLGQVLYDLYGIRLGTGTYLLDEHSCPHEALDRRTALNIADHVIVLANRMPMKDLLKHELRPTIEKMQTAIGTTKSSPQMQHNLRNYTEYLKTSIRPLHMYQALRGQVQVDSLPVVKQDTKLADQGWFFLLGMIHLTKFRQQKRLAPGTQQDDLRVGATFMRLQLQFTADHWETWYRLAQCFDLELEEEVLWNADKINSNSRQLIVLQRSAIHCYIMALSTAIRTADDSFETAEKLSEMYHDFGMRLYASSREPFENKAFWVDEYERHMSGQLGMYKRTAHDEMGKYKVWKYASALFRKALVDKPKNWMSHYMLGKCQWKMYCKAPEDDRDRKSRPSMWSALDSFVKAIETVPKHKDSRAEPVLEPHYKLMSAVHKLVATTEMDPQAGADLLQQQPFAIRKGEHVVVTDYTEWEAFILETFRHIRNADKSHWHHRMVARVARILCDPDTSDYIQATAARLEFRESILTKTMHVQVWKPEAERPGRHHVYMERYVRFIIKIMLVLNDKAGLDALAKRVRKRAGDYYHFNIVWQECCTGYLKLIRRSGEIPSNMEEIFKGVSHEEFEMLSDRLNTWLADPNMSHPALDALREVVELKKLNQNLMKGVLIDDAINDSYAVLYSQVAKALPGSAAEPSAIPQLDGEAPPRTQGPMSLNNLLMDSEASHTGLPGLPPPSTALPSEAGAVPSSAEQSARPKRSNLRRTDIIKKAESIVAKAAEVPRVAQASSRSRRSSQPSLAVDSNSNNGGTPPSQSANGAASTPALRSAAVSELQNEAETTKDDSSPPGSVHDSADDESDLSDVPDMDDVEEAMVFPTLVRKPTSVESSDEEEEEDEDDGEEAEEDGEDHGDHEAEEDEEGGDHGEGGDDGEGGDGEDGEGGDGEDGEGGEGEEGEDDKMEE
ncbi:hypothetical protein BP6252_01264 [Coleophoma cylindrospora]|uniref:Histone transcription regulator 3 homolog n=1 Tax=Coleophoma cylindrospora TaxID=1849047 RepID=A0A3D8SSG1_9HELO|nr:hypothetical protein BP6252_01264 [Coleophoma cylindrospora]